MAMYNPAHPGELIRDEILVPLGLSVTETAKRLGVSRKTLSKVLNCRGAVTPEMAVRMEMLFGQSAELWVKMQVAYDLFHVRKKAKRVSYFSYRSACSSWHINHSG